MPITTAMLRWFTSATYIDNTSQEISAKDVRDGFNMVADAIDTAVVATAGADPETVKDWADATALLAISAQDSAALASTKATEAAASATGSLANKNAAASSAAASTTKAAEAAASAADAQTSKNSAASSATTSTTKAAESAASAAAALTSKNSAASSAVTATNKAADAEAAAAIAVAKATDAATSAALAASAVTTVGGRNPKIGNMSVTDNTINSGNYHYDSANGSSGGPAGSIYGHITHYRRAAGGGEAQVFIFENPTSIHIRSRTTGAWNTWTKLAFDTYPTVFATVVEFKAAIAASIYSGVPSGFSVTAGGTTYIRGAAFTAIPGLSGWYLPWMKQKHLLSADWQPIDAPQVTRLRATLDAIAVKHPDLTHAHILGDLVDTASVNSTGAAPLYGFPEFLADWRTRLPIPLGRAFFLPGNHDLDGFGTGSHRFAWSLATYRRWMGREYYSTLQGNLLNIYLGDMGGSNGGEITDAVMNWATSLIRNNADKNIIINLHQPLNNTYASETEATQAALFITNSARLTSVLSTVPNVAAVFYGHVGSANQFFDRTLYNTRHLQIGMHLPGNVIYSRDDLYYTMDFQHGSGSFSVTQHNATTGATGATKTITLAFPLQLGEDYTHDGRDDEMEGPRVSPLVVRVPVDDVTNLTTPYAPDTSKVHWVGDFGMNDRSNHDMPAGFKVGIGISYPGAAKVTNPGADGDSYFVSSGENATVGMYAVSRGGADPTSGIELTFVTGNEGVGDDTMTLYPQYLSDLKGIHTPHHIRVGGALAGVEDHGVTTRTGVSLSDSGRIFASTTASLSVLSLQRASATDGYFATFRRGTTLIGSINSAGSTTSFNTTSDKRLKDDWQEFDGISTIMALEVWDHAWRAHDHRSKGVLAQDAVLVAPYAVTEGDDETPWSVDYSKLVPDLIRAVQQLSARVEELEGAANGK